MAKLLTYFETVKTDPLGQIFLTGILEVGAYDTVNVEIIQWPHAAVSMTVQCQMGKISGETLSEDIGVFPLGTTAQIHSFPVVGPEFTLVLTGGPPETEVPLQGWVFLK